MVSIEGFVSVTIHSMVDVIHLLDGWIHELISCVFQDCCLIVYHPYRPLLQYVQDMGQEDMLLPLAWYELFFVGACIDLI